MTDSAPTACTRCRSCLPALTVLAVGDGNPAAGALLPGRLAALLLSSTHRRLAAHHGAGVPQQRPSPRPPPSGRGSPRCSRCRSRALQYHFASVITGQWRRQRRGIAGCVARVRAAARRSSRRSDAGWRRGLQLGLLPAVRARGLGVRVLHRGRGGAVHADVLAAVPRATVPAASRRGAGCCCSRACPWPPSVRSTSCRRSAWQSSRFGGARRHGGNVVNAYTTWRYRLVEITPAYAARSAHGLDERRGGVDRPGRYRAAGQPRGLRDPGHRPHAAAEPPAARVSLAQRRARAGSISRSFRPRTPPWASATTWRRTAAGARWTSA